MTSKMTGGDDVLRQKEIYKAVVAGIKKYYKCKIYNDEITEGYATPCFFIKLLKRVTPTMANFSETQLTIIITYIPDAVADKQIEFLDVEDTLTNLFQIGIPAGDRFLKTENIDFNYAGEDKDILEATMEYNYLDDTAYSYSNGRWDKNKPDNIPDEKDTYLIEDVHTNIKPKQ